LTIYGFTIKVNDSTILVVVVDLTYLHLLCS
jgi:hypothetical protein